jgi:DNA-binding FadR family transcriptional regulator
LKHTKLDESVNLFAEERMVQRNTLKSQVAEKLMYMISTGLIAPDDFLPSERNLSETFSVSRETIRGALQILSSKKLIEVARGTRTRILAGPTVVAGKELVANLVDQLENYDVTTVAEARRVVEAAIVKSAAINISSSDLKKLAAMMDTQEKVLDDAVAFQISDREFHKLIYNSGGNTLLEKMASNIYSYALEFRNMALKAERATERSLREHRQIYRALEQHDPDAAERAMTGHVDSIFKSSIMMMQAAEIDH